MAMRVLVVLMTASVVVAEDSCQSTGNTTSALQGNSLLQSGMLLSKGQPPTAGVEGEGGTMAALVGMGGQGVPGWQCVEDNPMLSNAWCGCAQMAERFYGLPEDKTQRPYMNPIKRLLAGAKCSKSFYQRCYVNGQGSAYKFARVACSGCKRLCPAYKVRGWAADLQLYSQPTQPCNMDQFKFPLVHQMSTSNGAYVDTGESGGFCRSIPAHNVDAVRCQFEQNNWVDSATGWTYLPHFQSKKSKGMLFDMICGWHHDLSLYGDGAPCDVSNFDTAVATGEGYYVDPLVPGGWCRKIPAQNVAAVRSGHQQGQWQSSASGVTYLPK